RRQILVGGLAALTLGACGNKTHDGLDGPQSSGPVAGGELLFAFDGAAVTQFTLDPHHSGFAPHHRIMRSIFDSLVVALPGQRIGAWLARSWEIAPDGRVYTFHLRQDVKFHDGTSFDAHAVKANFDRLAEPRNGLLWRTDLGPYEASNVRDDCTLEVRFSAA